MGNLLSKVKGVLSEAWDFHVATPSAVFKLFISTVLFQFAILSLVSIASGGDVKDIGTLEQTFQSAHYWWGLLGLFGSASLIFERYIKGNIVALITGYSTAIASLALLSYDFVTTKPPVHTGGILAATAVVFLGGLLYGRIKRK